MKRLKIKQWPCLLSFIMCITLFQGCDKRVSYNDLVLAQFGFILSEQVVEVGADTKSFRIEGKWKGGDGIDEDIVIYSPYAKSPRVYLDTTNTTALPGVHFINDVELRLGTIGDFTPMDSEHMYYREVNLLPENIESEIIIYYDIDTGRNIHDLIHRHKVILRPKNSN